MAKGRHEERGGRGEGERRAEAGGANAWKREVENVTAEKKDCFRQ